MLPGCDISIGSHAIIEPGCRPLLRNRVVRDKETANLELARGIPVLVVSPGIPVSSMDSSLPT